MIDHIDRQAEREGESIRRLSTIRPRTKGRDIQYWRTRQLLRSRAVDEYYWRKLVKESIRQEKKLQIGIFPLV